MKFLLNDIYVKDKLLAKMLPYLKILNMKWYIMLGSWFYGLIYDPLYNSKLLYIIK